MPHKAVIHSVEGTYRAGERALVGYLMLVKEAVWRLGRQGTHAKLTYKR